MNRIERPTTLRSAADLFRSGLAAPSDEATLERVAQRYAVAVTTHLADLIDADDPDDPIARQFVPSADELKAHPGERGDPIGDDAHRSEERRVGKECRSRWS